MSCPFGRYGRCPSERSRVSVPAARLLDRAIHEHGAFQESRQCRAARLLAAPCRAAGLTSAAGTGSFPSAEQTCPARIRAATFGREYLYMQLCLAVAYNKLGRRADAEGTLSRIQSSVGTTPHISTSGSTVRARRRDKRSTSEEPVRTTTRVVWA